MSILTELARIWLTRSVRPFSFTSAYDSSLDLREEQNLGLYLHIPFCRTLCSFCPYCKVPYQEELAKAYLDALLKEIDLEFRNGSDRFGSSRNCDRRMEI